MTFQTDDPRYALLNTFMYARPRRRRRHHSSVFCVLILVSASLLSIPFVLRSDSNPLTNASAAAAPTRVQGYVYDVSGSVVSGAQVDVVFLTSKASWSGSTDISGYYQSGTIGKDNWIEGETIEVTATYGSDKSVNTSLAKPIPVQVVDVTLSILIPEIGNSFDLMLVLIASTALVVGIGHRVKSIRE